MIPISQVNSKELLNRLLLLFFSIMLVLIAAEFTCRLLERTQSVVVRNVSPTNSESGQAIKHVRVKNTPVAGLFTTTPMGERLIPNTHVTIENHRLSGKNIEINTNSLGYRNYELAEKTNSEFRILVLGDSITLGDYVSDDETYVRNLEKEFAKEKGKKNIVRVINAGVGAIDLKTEYFILEETGLSTKPDLVLIGSYLNDASPSLGVKPLPFPFDRSRFLEWCNWKIVVLKKIFFQRKRKELAEKWVASFKGPRNLIRGDWKNEPNAFDAEILSAFDDWGYAWTDTAWEEMGKTYAKIKELEKAYHFKTVVVLFPVRHQVESKFVNEIPQVKFHNLLSSLKIPHFDLLPTLRKAWQVSSKQLYYDHCHLTPYGNSTVANSIYHYLKDQNLVPIEN